MCLAVPLPARLGFSFSLFLLSWLLFSLCVSSAWLAGDSLHNAPESMQCMLAIIYYVAAGVEANSTINCCYLLSINGALAAKVHSALFARLTTVHTLFIFSLTFPLLIYILKVNPEQPHLK